MEYTHHLTAYSESAGLLDESAAETVLPSEEVNGSEPLPNNNDYNDALDPCKLRYSKKKKGVL